MSQSYHPSCPALPTEPPASPLLTQPEAWQYCSMSRATWYKCKRLGPRPMETYLPTGGLRYRRADLDAWLSKLVNRQRRAPKSS